MIIAIKCLDRTAMDELNIFATRIGNGHLAMPSAKCQPDLEHDVGVCQKYMRANNKNVPDDVKRTMTSLILSHWDAYCKIFLRRPSLSAGIQVGYPDEIKLYPHGYETVYVFPHAKYNRTLVL